MAENMSNRNTPDNLSGEESGQSRLGDASEQQQANQRLTPSDNYEVGDRAGEAGLGSATRSGAGQGANADDLRAASHGDPDKSLDDEEDLPEEDYMDIGGGL